MNQVKNVERDLRLGTEKVSDGKGRVIGIKSYCRVFRVLYNTSYLSKNSSETCLKILTKPRYNLGIRSAIPEEIEVSHKFGRGDLDVTDRNQKMHISFLGTIRD